MFARRVANHRGFGRPEKMNKKQQVNQIMGVLKEVHLNQVPANKENRAVSKIPVVSNVHKQQRVSIKGAVTKRVAEVKTKNVTKQAKKEAISDLMPTGLSVYDDEVMVTCEEEPLDEPCIRDIHRYLQQIESKCCPRLECIQKDITAENRRVLLAWMRDVQDFLNMHQETFHLAITIIDMVVQNSNVKLHEYQLLGLVALFIAAKFMERFVPEVDTLMYLASYAYNSQLILQKEREVLQLLDYDLNLPTPTWFLEYYAKDTESSSVRRLAEAFMDIFILDFTSVTIFPPSILAASSLMVAARLRGRISAQWLSALLSKCSYSDHDLDKANTRLLNLIQSIDKTKMCSIEEKVAALL